jgi:hypothetical protein
LNFASYFFTAVWASLWLKKPNVVVATSPQLFCGWAGVWAARLKRVPFVLEIRDIWPESIAAVGAMRKGKRVRLLEWLERKMYLAATHIVAVGTGYRDNILGKVPSMKERVSVITNGVDGNQFRPQPRCPELVERYQLDGKYVCSYVGTVGMAHGLEVVVDAAERLQHLGRKDIVFMIVGDGARRAALEEMARDRGVADQIVFTGRLPKKEMPAILATSDCCLVHLRGTELFGTVIPSKIFETMAMQRPIIMGVAGPALGIVMEAHAGHAMTPESDEELAQIVVGMADDLQRTTDMGRDARQYVLDYYNRDELSSKYLELLHSISGSPLHSLPVVEPVASADQQHRVDQPARVVLTHEIRPTNGSADEVLVEKPVSGS